MARKKRTSRLRPRKPARTKKKTARGSARPRGRHQHRPELVGLVLAAIGVFLVAVLWLGWNGGLVGGWVADGCRGFLGWAAYPLPAGLVAVGSLMVGRSALVRFRPFRTGEALTALGLLLVLGSAHGGWLGRVLAHGLGALIGGTGTTIVGVLALLCGALLLSGASLGAILRRSGRAVRTAASHTRRPRPRDTVSQGRTALDPVSEPTLLVPATAPVDAEAVYPDVVGEAPTQEQGREPDSEELADDPPTLFDLPASTPDYRLPDPSLLARSKRTAGPSKETGARTAELLVQTLASFGVDAVVVGQISGPRVTRYELQLAAGTKVAKVAQLRDDLAYALATTEIRILAPIPGKQAVGVEVPNLSPNIVTLGDIYGELPATASPLSVWLGKDISGAAVWTDLARMPHVLIAGTTGSGKSGCINAILTSILLRSTPDDVRLILIDPKRVELNYYESIPHLLTPVVSSPKEAAAVLANCVAEMERRYERLSILRARNLPEANRALRKRGETQLPYLLVVIDELADLMMISPQAVEEAIIRLAQKSRAVGIHLVLATQRPSVDVITGMIKANVPSRIAFAVSSQTDSRVILDSAGAESLLGQGDMLFKPLGTSRVQRVQGAYVGEEEIALVVEACRKQRGQELDESLLELPEAFADGDDGDEHGEFDPDEDPLLDKAIEIVVQAQTASTSLLQRRLRVGYTRAGRLVDMLERRGIISGYEGSKPRRVLVDETQLQTLADRG
ncbi:MAG TPA: DNA translocase FtsK [Gaiellaceae bacterium]|nr:DNA translocase FtsK [Gaiellaceae bacterium]